MSRGTASHSASRSACQDDDASSNSSSHSADDSPAALEELRAVLLREHVGRVRDRLFQPSLSERPTVPRDVARARRTAANLTQSCPMPRGCPHLPLPMRAGCHPGELAAPLLQAGPARARIAAREARSPPPARLSRSPSPGICASRPQSPRLRSYAEDLTQSCPSRRGEASAGWLHRAITVIPLKHPRSEVPKFISRRLCRGTRIPT